VHPPWFGTTLGFPLAALSRETCTFLTPHFNNFPPRVEVIECRATFLSLFSSLAFAPYVRFPSYFPYPTNFQESQVVILSAPFCLSVFAVPLFPPPPIKIYGLFFFRAQTFLLASIGDLTGVLVISCLILWLMPARPVSGTLRAIWFPSGSPSLIGFFAALRPTTLLRRHPYGAGLNQASFFIF